MLSYILDRNFKAKTEMSARLLLCPNQIPSFFRNSHWQTPFLWKNCIVLKSFDSLLFVYRTWILWKKVSKHAVARQLCERINWVHMRLWNMIGKQSVLRKFDTSSNGKVSKFMQFQRHLCCNWNSRIGSHISKWIKNEKKG